MEWCSLQGALQRGSCGTATAPPPLLRFVVVAVTQVAYEVEGWGVGELYTAR